MGKQTSTWINESANTYEDKTTKVSITLEKGTYTLEKTFVIEKELNVNKKTNELKIKINR